MRRAQVVKLSSGDREGSGYLLTSRHVLTAKHVIDPTETGARCRIQALSAPDTSATDLSPAQRPSPWRGHAAWMSDKHDLAIVTLDADPVPGIRPLRFGWVPSEEPAFYQCLGIGFPAAAKENSRQIEAKLSWVLDDQRFDLDIGTALPTKWKEWAGLSGAVIFSSDLLVGVVRTVRGNWNGLLTATPVQYLIEDPRFRSFWTREACPEPDTEVVTHGRPELDSKYRNHSLAAMREAGNAPLGVPIDTLIEEETRSSPSPPAWMEHIDCWSPLYWENLLGCAPCLANVPQRVAFVGALVQMH